jgi:hypothetical protein
MVACSSLPCLCAAFDPAGSASLDAAAINNADFRGKPPAEDKVDTAGEAKSFSTARCSLGKLTASSPKIPKGPASPRRREKPDFQKTLTLELFAKLTETGRGCHRAIHHHGKRREGTVPEKAAGQDGERKTCLARLRQPARGARGKNFI